jgi:hypothetical protein
LSFQFGSQKVMKKVAFSLIKITGVGVNGIAGKFSKKNLRIKMQSNP